MDNDFHYIEIFSQVSMVPRGYFYVACYLPYYLLLSTFVTAVTSNNR